MKLYKGASLDLRVLYLQYCAYKGEFIPEYLQRLLLNPSTKVTKITWGKRLAIKMWLLRGKPGCKPIEWLNS